MIKTERLTIGENDWSCTQFSGTKSLAVIHLLASTLGPAIAGVLQSRNSGQEDLHGMISDVVARIDSADRLQSTVLRLLAGTHVNNRPMTPEVFDDVFAGLGIRDLVPALGFVIRTNYGDFSKAAKLAMDITGRSAAESQSPAQSPGSSVPS